MTTKPFRSARFNYINRRQSGLILPAPVSVDAYRNKSVCGYARAGAREASSVTEFYEAVSRTAPLLLRYLKSTEERSLGCDSSSSKVMFSKRRKTRRGARQEAKRYVCRCLGADKHCRRSQVRSKRLSVQIVDGRKPDLSCVCECFLPDWHKRPFKP